MDYAIAILSLLAGIGVFLIACTMLSGNLETICSTKLRTLFAKASEKKLVGVGIGTVATAAIQSSGATTVLVIGFVNAGIMSLTLAAAIIYGANIGTTITAQIVAWGSSGSSDLIMYLFAAMAGVGAFIAAYGKKDRTRSLGSVIAGFGMLFVGLELMSDAMGDFAQEPAVREFLSHIENVILLVIIGAILTAIVQSSSVMTAVIIAMIGAGLLDLNQGIYLTLGSNIGSCIVAILAGMSSGLNAKRTALIHFLFNVFGVIIFMVFGFFMRTFTGTTFGDLFYGVFPTPQIDLAMFHTTFNVITVIIMLPLTSKLIALVTKILPGKNGHQEAVAEAPHLYFVDDHMLKTPAIAVGEVTNEITNMASTAMKNFKISIEALTTLETDNLEEFRKNDRQLDYTNEELTKFLLKLSNTKLSDKDSSYVSTAFRTITDLKRVGDYSENIVEYAQRLKTIHNNFSDYACDEVRQAETLVEKLYERVICAYVNKDSVSLDEAYDIEEQVDELTDNMADNHIKRMGEGVCSPSVGAEFLSATSDIERIADHLMNVGKTIKANN